MTWRNVLGEDTNEVINELVKKSLHHHDAYAAGPHVRTSQLWCALSEVYTELRRTQNRLAQAEGEVMAMRTALKKSGQYMASH